MKGFTRRLCVVALGAAIAIIAVAAPGAVAGAGGPRAATSRCTATSGVTVIVDFTHFGGRIERGCAPGHPADALIALHAAGFDTAGTTQYGDAFVCRIDALPTPKQDACTVTPPASAFWAFWNARPSDAGWTFTPVGVLDYQPAAGSIEAFAFGSRVQPSIPPSAAVPSTTTTRATAPTTAPTTAQRSTAPPSTPAPPVSAATIAPVHPSSTGAPTTTVTPTTKRSTTHHKKRSPTPTSARAAAPTTSSLPRIVERSAAAPAAHTSAGSPLPAILTVAIVALLAGGAFVLTRLRRRTA